MRPTTPMICTAILALLAARMEPVAALPPPEKADKPEVVELDVKGLKFGTNKGPFINKYALLLPDEKSLDIPWKTDKADYKEIQEKIKKQVDFDKQQLLYFAWSGSSADELTYKVVDGEKKTLHVTYKPGADADIKGHNRLFAFPKGWLHKVEGGK